MSLLQSHSGPAQATPAAQDQTSVPLGYWIRVAPRKSLALVIPVAINSSEVRRRGPSCPHLAAPAGGAVTPRALAAGRAPRNAGGHAPAMSENTELPSQR